MSLPLQVDDTRLNEVLKHLACVTIRADPLVDSVDPAADYHERGACAGSGRPLGHVVGVGEFAVGVREQVEADAVFLREPAV